MKRLAMACVLVIFMAGCGVFLPAWYDESSQLWWQDSPPDQEYKWQEAIDYCDALVLGGYDDWHLPSISELRSLIRGCPGTQTGGGCGVTDSCLDYSECNNSACDGCAFLGGPGPGGCYWEGALGDNCGIFWSSSSDALNAGFAWGVSFDNDSGSVDDYGKTTNTNDVRCVRVGP